MPDISMCDNNNCPIKNDCYRFTATPNEFRQTYSCFTYNDKTKECKYFLDNEQRKKLKK